MNLEKSDSSNELIVDFAPTSVRELLVDFKHRRSSYLESEDSKIDKAVELAPLAEIRFFERFNGHDASERYFTKEDYQKFKANAKAGKRIVHQRNLSHLSDDGSKSQETDQDLHSVINDLESMLSPSSTQETVQQKSDDQARSGCYDPLMVAPGHIYDLSRFCQAKAPSAKKRPKIRIQNLIKRKARVQRAVLDEQEQHHEFSCYDPDTIQRGSSLSTSVNINNSNRSNNNKNRRILGFRKNPFDSLEYDSSDEEQQGEEQKKMDSDSISTISCSSFTARGA